MIRILTIVGARPQFIKAAIVSRTFKNSNFISETIVHTGQHFDFEMDKIFFNELSIPAPRYNLNINSLSHGEMTGRMLTELEKIIKKEKPDFVLVYGDTNSTLAGALAAKKLFHKIVHVEAGLRSFNMRMPEEINRILTDRISDILFCPTENAVKNLTMEGFNQFDCKVVFSGDVMYDLALFAQKILDEMKMNTTSPSNEKYIICTIHREENTNDIEKLKSIVNALEMIAQEIQIIFPIHPRTKKIFQSLGLNPKFNLVAPVSYFEMAKMLQNCSLVITDSGGLQKEAFFFKKNCITVREETEWIELAEHNFNLVAGTQKDSIYNAYKTMINKRNDFNIKLYGDGNSCDVILQTLLNFS